MKILFFDLETTGFGFDKCAIIQLAAIMTELGTDNELKPLGAIDLKMRPRVGKMVDKRALEINKFTLEEIMTWESDKIAYKKFTDFILQYINKYDSMDKIKLCGYNSVHFDSDFLRQWFVENGDIYFGSYFWSDQMDIMCEASRYLMHYRCAMNNFKLGNVASLLGIKLDESSLHNGLYDVKMTYKIFKHILKSEHLIMPFTEEKAREFWDHQQKTKDTFKKPVTKLTDQDAWVTIE